MTAREKVTRCIVGRVERAQHEVNARVSFVFVVQSKMFGWGKSPSIWTLYHGDFVRSILASSEGKSAARRTPLVTPHFLREAVPFVFI